MANRASQKILVVDDDNDMLAAIVSVLEAAGFSVSGTTDSTWARENLQDLRPDAVVSDLMMPDVDGYDLCSFVKSTPELKTTRFIIHSAKTYEYDVKRAYEFGADGYLKKPLNSTTLVNQLSRILSDQIEMTFWGVRGTLPVTGPDCLKYGGQTNCISLEFPRQQLFILDSGTGIKAFGDHLIKEGRRAMKGHIMITHPHWDHINAIPFFTPLYIQGNEFEFIGANQGDLSMREIISAQMDGIYFPIELKEFAARVYFRDLGEETFDVEGITVHSKLLSHPGRCLGYRFEYKDRSICYITDNELYPEGTHAHNPHYEQQLADFCRGTDALITDSTYTDEEYKTKVDWGHSCISKVAELAHNAEAKTLYLYHHDPNQNDAAIDAKNEMAQEWLAKAESATKLVTPKERERFSI